MTQGTNCLHGYVCALKTLNLCRKVELLGEKNPVTLVGRPASAAQQIIAAADKLHDATRFRAEQLFVQVSRDFLHTSQHMAAWLLLYSEKLFWHTWPGKAALSAPFPCVRVLPLTQPPPT